MGRPGGTQVLIVFNGPSSKRYRGCSFSGPIFGCNFAYRDFECQYVFAVDYKAVEEIQQDVPSGIKLHTKNRPNIPQRWDTAILPGIDSGSYALQTALTLYGDSRIYVIGADGILKQNSATVYDYEWRKGRQPHSFTHIRHRKSCVDILNNTGKHRVRFVNDYKDSELETITHENFLRETNLELDAKHSIG